MEKIIGMLFLILGIFFNAQVKIDLKYTKGATIKVNILSKENLQLSTSLNSTTLFMLGEISEYPMYDNSNLYLFLFDENGKPVPQRSASILPHPDKDPSYYKKELKEAEKKRKAKYTITANKPESLNFDFLIYKNEKEVFKAYPCKMFDCSYYYYTLQKGKKYKMQVQLQGTAEVYKSNTVEFTY
ncbi:hypothetical protein [Chryseobacterium pennipullorum]|uniref:Uncharacterized protein n=1 Tax=Chryseobacterium pennipullorum TaxID=2258963 RepID=A0A3D9B324_9FLAO|nr:hypothetical protein [Chryseobacterium pennipullorum]REC48041.1 hypothetical protein DRF67_09125 [Chryseobacterium pennipullorum]